MLNDELGSFHDKNDIPTGPGASSVVAFNLNDDTLADLAVGNLYNKSVSVLPNVGNGAFVKDRDYEVGFGPSSVAIGDFNHDEFPDLVVATLGQTFGSGTETGSLSVLVNDTNGQFVDAAT